jgi:two-component system, OmpR family, phosphate regulon response regulator PhoB
VKKSITIIEDDKDLRTLVGLALNLAGYNVTSIAHANDFVLDNQKATELYLIDIDLGGVSGLDLCKKIKAQNMLVQMPVVIITSAHPDARLLTIGACADDFLAKPFTSKELLRKIAEYL